jgi:hypothetical protein
MSSRAMRSAEFALPSKHADVQPPEGFFLTTKPTVTGSSARVAE